MLDNLHGFFVDYLHNVVQKDKGNVYAHKCILGGNGNSVRTPEVMSQCEPTMIDSLPSAVEQIS